MFPAREWVGEKAPCLFGAIRRHFRHGDPDTELLVEAGVAVDYRSFDHMGHSTHGQDTRLFTDTVADWISNVLG